jgi:hypothetical protein
MANFVTEDVKLYRKGEFGNPSNWYTALVGDSNEFLLEYSEVFISLVEAIMFLSCMFLDAHLFARTRAIAAKETSWNCGPSS